MADLAIPQTKACTKCGVNKPLQNYAKKTGGLYGLRSVCRECQAISDAQRDPEIFRKNIRAWRKRNPGASRKYYLENREKHLANAARFAKANRERLNELQRKRRARDLALTRKRAAAYREANRQMFREATRRYDAKKRSTPRGRLENAVSSGISASLARGAKAGKKWQLLVGYSVDDLMRHLEAKFLPGMCWENYGEWHVDHIIPKSLFNYERPEHIDFQRCWQLSNLQPLWAIDNICKRAKLSTSFQPSLAL